MKVALDRALAGANRDFFESAWERFKGGAGVTGALVEELADRSLDRFAVHLKAAMRDKGFKIEDGETLTVPVLIRSINERTGLEIEALTPEGVAMAVDTLLAKKLSQELGVAVTTIADPEALRQSLLDGALEAVRAGRGNRLLSRATIGRLRRAATWARAGIPESERRRWLARWYQRKFRKTHVAQWR